MKRRNIIFLLVLIALAGGGITVWYMWNKPHLKVEDQEAVVVDAPGLYTAFTTNEQQANTTYLNKTLQVAGKVTELSKNQDGKTVAILEAGDPLGGIQCTFRESNVVVNTGEQITTKGFCNGYTMVVVLNDCILTK
jgi:hypothetical protein